MQCIEELRNILKEAEAMAPTHGELCAVSVPVELVRKMIMEPAETQAELDAVKELEAIKAHVSYLTERNNALIAQVKALAFAVRCGGISGKDVCYEID